MTMFFKYATLLAFAASAFAGDIQPGVYKIINVASHSTARSYNPSNPVFVSSTREFPGPFELWDVKDSVDGSYTLRNIGLNTIAAAGPSGFVVTEPKATSFSIEPAGDGEFVIKLPDADSVWNVELPVIPRGDIRLRPANGSPTQRWTFALIDSAQDRDDYVDKWELLQRIGRFLDRF